MASVCPLYCTLYRAICTVCPASSGISLEQAEYLKRKDLADGGCTTAACTVWLHAQYCNVHSIAARAVWYERV